MANNRLFSKFSQNTARFSGFENYQTKLERNLYGFLKIIQGVVCQSAYEKVIFQSSAE